MTKIYVALFRGINVGGHHSLPMKELVSILESLSCRNVRTYIQSGNAVFHSETTDGSRLTDAIRREIGKRKGFEPQVLLLDRKNFMRSMAKNPFPDAEKDPQMLHVGFLAAKPTDPDLATLERIKGRRERFRLVGDCFYLHAPDGFGRSKVAAATERCLGVPMTDRNWKSVCAIKEIIDSIE